MVSSPPYGWKIAAIENPPSSFLTLRTEVETPPAQNTALNRRAAADTGFAGAPVDLGAVSAFFAEGVAVARVGQRGAAALHGAAQHGFHGAMQATRFVVGQRRAESFGMDARLKQGFVRVDVSDAGDDALVEQRGFDFDLFLLQRLGKLTPGELWVKRFGSHLAQTRYLRRLRHGAQFAKCAGVHEA